MAKMTFPGRTNANGAHWVVDAPGARRALRYANAMNGGAAALCTRGCGGAAMGSAAKHGPPWLPSKRVAPCA